MINQLKKTIHSISPRILPFIKKVRNKIFFQNKNSSKEAVQPVKPYHVRIKHSETENRKKILHVIANFWTGGSARLVVDIIEHLGHIYEQEIITRDIPPTPAYTGVQLFVCNDVNDAVSFASKLQQFQPHLIHIHYLGHHKDEWGEQDWQWYDNLFKSISNKYKTVENINIPTQPYIHDCVSNYIYVSNYVKNEFGFKNEREVVIYPGSDFSFFERSENSTIPEDCIGMVYRLERDKINEASIEVFIEVVKRRKHTKAIIVGGGNLLNYYKQRVAEENLSNAFEFTGYVPYEELPSFFEKMSIFVAPVHHESFGQVTPFAMSMQLPVAGYNVGALPEIINNSELLATAGNYKQLAAIIIDLLNDRKKRVTIGLKNQQRAKELFSVEAMIQAYRKIYEEVLN